MPPSSTNNFFGIKVSKAGIPVHQASDKQLVYKDDFSTKTYYDATVPRMVEGLLPDGTYGLWVSEPGVDVTVATDDQLIFNSNQDVFKIVKKVSLSLSITTSGTGSATGSTFQPHDLDYIPAYIAFITVDTALMVFSPIGLANGPNPTVISAAASGGGKIFGFFSVTVDDININFGGQVSVGGSTTFVNSATVYLLQETFS